mmetsp:Transcript_25940/g.29657  ORF Transcript_25940/g.29657 Transcript_25940/m.29657 type:complete len:522 (+) Transcript_25940:173-1738(+)
MDFAKKLVQIENVTTKSGITLVPLPDNSKYSENNQDVSKEENAIQKEIDTLMVQSANKAASELFLSTGAKIYSTLNKIATKETSSPNSPNGNNEVKKKQNLSFVDCKLYPTQYLPPSDKILPSSLVVIFESFDSLNFVYATPGEVFHNRNGHFAHDDFINKPYGCIIRSRNNQGVGFVYLLKPTPELWQRSLNHRTQIVHELDASVIVFHLNLRPNMVVCESGTGSGALSHCIMRSIAPYGKLHTFEFNHSRTKAAKEEFKKNGVDHLVQVHWRDVCGKPKSYEKGQSGNCTNSNGIGTLSSLVTSDNEKDDATIGVGGFAIGPAAADAIFLDLPEPWLAIPHAAHTIKPYGSICSYSPCVEQSQQTIQKMKEYGFHSIKTIEVRLREHYVDEVQMNTVPTMKLPREPIIPYVPGAAASSSNSGTCEKTESNEKKSESKVNDATEGDGCEKKDNNNSTETDSTETEPDIKEKGEKKNVKSLESKKRKLICGRPFPIIKGHTAFLTFAHAGNISYPDPLDKK